MVLHSHTGAGLLRLEGESERAGNVSQTPTLQRQSR